MKKAITDSLEISLFLGLTFFLYLIFIVTIPIFRDSHGLLTLNELSDVSRSGLVKGLLFGSASVCVLIGILMMEAVPSFTPAMMANFWAITYFYLWGDSLVVLTVQSQSLKFFTAFGLGISFIYLFFLAMALLGFDRGKLTEGPVWKMNLMNYWVWGWMGFYFGLSALLAFDSYKYFSDRWVLAFGAMTLCFLNYLFCLFLRKAMNKEVDRFSRAGRSVFLTWSLLLAAAWILQRWVI